MLLAKGYPDIGWNPCGGEKYLDFLRFAVFVNGLILVLMQRQNPIVLIIANSSRHNYSCFLGCRRECRGECQRGSTPPHSEARVLRPCPERRGWQRSVSGHRRGHQDIGGPCEGWADHEERQTFPNVSVSQMLAMASEVAVAAVDRSTIFPAIGLEERSNMRRTGCTWEMPSCHFTPPLLTCLVAVLRRCM